jgi:3-oxoacyl-[acyl-carrier protein] reductase
MQITMNGRAAIVTGGSKGIGFAIASSFASCGADVAIVARGQESLDAAVAEIKKVAKGKVTGVAADVGTAAGAQQAYDGAVAALGKVDIVVNNAGTSATGPFEKLTDELMQADLDLKLFAAIRLSRLAWPGMKERKWGRIINILNVGAKAPRPNSAPTSISRAAGMALTKVLSGEGAAHNILVNALLVGLIEADQHVQAAKKKGISTEEHLANLAKDIPLGRVGKAQEFANIAVMLASDAGSYVTGTAINIDGGRSPVV